MRRSLQLVLAGAWILTLAACGGKSLTGQECGNGLIEGTEVCEATELDGQSCTDHGFTGGILACEADCTAFDTSLCGDFECGNGLVEPGESCEATDLDGEDCVSRGFSGGTLACANNCSFDTSGCTQPGCNDGVISGTEDCDGTNLGGATCVSEGFTGGTLACAANCSFDTSGCSNATCGNDSTESPEVCDGADLNSLGCTDFGFTGGTLDCLADCSDYDRGACTGAGCGNGIIEPGEVCDLTALGGLTCGDFGFDAGTLACSSTCDAFDDTGCSNATCGDGTAEGAEECDGADLLGQDCVSLAQGYTGGTLACDGTCAFDTSACTLAPPAGDDCASAAVIPPGALPLTLVGDTSTGTDDYSAAAGSCAGMGGEGFNAADVVYELTPTTDGAYTFTYDPANYDAAIYVVTDCADIANTCLGGSEAGQAGGVETLVVSLTSGTTYYVILDGGGGGQAGAYTLGVSAPCAPDCTGKTCGDDGCGGSCGACTGGDVCDPATWSCVDPATLGGDDCSDPIVVPGVPYTTVGITTGRANDYTADAACPGIQNDEGEGSPDVVYEFTPTQSGIYPIDYEPTFDGALYVVTDCADVAGSCLGASESASFNPPWNELLDASMVAGTTYYIIVDGGIPGGVDGTYSLSIGAPCLPDCTGKQCGPDGCGGSCGLCTGTDVCDDIQGLCLDPSQVPGEDCGNPVLVNPNNLPFVYTEDTTGSTDAAEHSANSCPGENGAQGVDAGDHAFELSPSVAGVYEIRLTTTTWDGVFYVVRDCADIDNTCEYSQDDVGWGTETASVTLSATETYYIIVDGWGNSGDEGPYQLFIGQPCVPDCTGRACGGDGCGGSCGTCQPGEGCDPAGQCIPTPGNTCANAITVGSVPYTDSGDTGVGTTNNYAAVAACPGIGGTEGEGSPDVAYEFTPAVTGDYTIRYVPTFDGALYVVTDCADIANTCLAASEAASGGAPWDEVINLTLTAGTTYYIIVDGGIPGGVSGPYTLDICLPDCTGRVCGDDGCGGSCGTCAGGETCSTAGQCNPSPGNRCSSAIVIGSAPYSDTGDTSVGFTNDYSTGAAGSCAGIAGTEGEASPDVVYSFTPGTSATYQITYVPTFDGALYVATDCADIDNTCLAGSEAASQNPPWDEVVSVAMTAGTTYYIFVDGGLAGGGVSGPYTLDVGAACTPSCAGAVCGDDGCGGSCGSCQTGETCNGSGQCVTTPGEACANATTVAAVPYAGSFDTTGMADDYSSVAGGACPGSGTAQGVGAGDHVFAFTPPATADYTITVDPAATWDAAFYIVTDCTDIANNCLAAVDQAWDGGAETTTINLTGGVTYYIVVDGWGNSGDEGPFDITIQ
ncbi:MAG: hypothetical protein ABI333_17850 [bacterium]